MASAGELLKRSSKRVERIKKTEPRAKKSSRYSRPWQENIEEVAKKPAKASDDKAPSKPKEGKEKSEITTEASKKNSAEEKKEAVRKAEKGSPSPEVEGASAMEIGEAVASSSKEQKDEASERPLISDSDFIPEFDAGDLGQKKKLLPVEAKKSLSFKGAKKVAFYQKIQAELSGDRAIQYLMLLEMCDDNGIIGLSQYDLVKNLGMDKQVVRKMFRYLVEKSYLEIIREYDPLTRLPRIYKALVR